MTNLQTLGAQGHDRAQLHARRRHERVRGARRYSSAIQLTKMSDLTAVQDQLKWGLATDCPTNALCGAPGGALSQYGITPETIAGSHTAVSRATCRWRTHSRTRPLT